MGHLAHVADTIRMYICLAGKPEMKKPVDLATGKKIILKWTLNI